MTAGRVQGVAGSVLALVMALLPAPARALCDVIPGAGGEYLGAEGSANRPFASPGDAVAIALDNSCDAGPASSFEALPDDNLVTIVFTPPQGAASAVVIPFDPADCAAVEAACQAELPGARVRCATDATGFTVTDDGMGRYPRLVFRFPDTDVMVDAAQDLRTLVGPARIGVSRSVDGPLCGELASTRCADLAPSAALACVGELYDIDGSCDDSPANVDPDFGHFIGLPPPNDFQALCTGSTICDAKGAELTGLVPEIRLAVDEKGNVLWPVNWRGVLVDGEIPVPRIVTGGTTAGVVDPGPTLTIGGAFERLRVPGPDFLASFSTRGIRVPPLFSPFPEADDATRMFGSVDAPRGVVRILRQGPVPRACSLGDATLLGRPCIVDGDCGNGGVCGGAVCQGGSAVGDSCVADVQCPGSECGPELFELRGALADSGLGPIVIPASLFALGAEFEAPIEGMAVSEDMTVLLRSEPSEGTDLTGDAQTTSSAVVTLLPDGADQPAPIGTNASPGISTLRARYGRFRLPAFALEDDTLALVQSDTLLEAGVTVGPGQLPFHAQTLRVFRADGAGGVTELLGGSEPVDGAAWIDGRSVAVSEGLVFYRRPEVASVPMAATDNVTAGGSQIEDSAIRPVMTGDGTKILFSFGIPGWGGLNDFTLNLDVHDLQNGLDDWNLAGYGPGGTVLGTPTTLPLAYDVGSIDLSADGSQLVFTSGGAVYAQDASLTVGVLIANPPGGQWYRNARISGDGRHVAFGRGFVHDRDVDRDGIFDEPGQIQTVELVSGEIAESVRRLEMDLSQDGRYVAAARDDGVSPRQIWVFDRDSDGDGIFDETLPTPGVRITDDGDGNPGDAGSSGPRISPDGRFVAFTSNAKNLVGGSFVSGVAYVADRDLDEDGVFDEPGQTAIYQASIATDGSVFSGIGLSLSSDGRYLGFRRAPTQTSGRAYVFDLETGLAEFVESFNQESGIFDINKAPLRDNDVSIGDGGRLLAFAGKKGTTDTDVFIAGVDYSSPGSYDLSGDGDFDDTMLYVFDSGVGGSPIPVAPADRVAVSAGRAAFLSPEAADGSPACASSPASCSLNGDGDANDRVVFLYEHGQGAENLELAADEIVLSSTYVAALASEAGEQSSLNGDADTKDRVVQVRSVVSGSDWVNLGLAGETLRISGSIVAFTTPEASQGADLNLDGDQNDVVLHIYDAAAGEFLSLQQWVPDGLGGFEVVDLGAPAVLDFALGSQTAAFRADEGGQAGVDSRLCDALGTPCDMNHDGDAADGVLHVVDLATGEVVNTTQAARPCPFEVCDPRVPYRIVGANVSFLSFEPDQSGGLVALGALAPGCSPLGTDCDLNGDGDATDLVVQHFKGGAFLLGASADQSRDTLAHTGGGICTTTAEPCFVDSQCAPGVCFLPPGGCTSLTATECYVAPICSGGSNPGGACETNIDCPGGSCTGSCTSSRYCLPDGGSSLDGYCAEVIGSCTSDAECMALGGAFCEEESLAGDATFASPFFLQSSGQQVFLSGGRCVVDTQLACTDDSDCAYGETCGASLPTTCERLEESCATAADCASPGAVCRPAAISAGADDTDGDGVADLIDNCPRVANPAQIDDDGDRLGDACDSRICGDGSQTYAEECDDGNFANGDGCSTDCLLEGANPACDNGLDDDGDGFVDLADAGCTNAADTSEREAGRACDDGIDNDGDGAADFPLDEGCMAPGWSTESPPCDDGIDNDADGQVDYPADPGCSYPSDLSEVADCQDGLDNDGDGNADYPADTDCSSPADPIEAPICADGFDNDGDNAVDWPADSDCTSATDQSEGPTPACSNGLDDDGDGLVDLLDPGCFGPLDTSETSADVCDDGLDNDGDGLFDYPEDPGCSGLADSDERGTSECDDGLDNDGNGSMDFSATPGAGDPGCTSAADDFEMTFAPGDILVSDFNNGTIYRVDPGTGATVAIFSGYPLVNPYGITLDHEGRLLVVDYADRLIRYDLESGEATIVSAEGFLSQPRGVAVENDGHILVADAPSDVVARIDPDTGAQTQLAPGPGGGSITVATGVVVAPSGIYATNRTSTVDPIVYIDSVTGNVSTFSNGTFLQEPWLLAVEADGDLLTVDSAKDTVIEIDVPTGIETDRDPGNTWSLSEPRGIAIEEGGTWIVTESVNGGQVYRLTPGGGQATVTSAIANPIGVVVLPPAQCSDGVDQDGDGLTDLLDPDCRDPRDNSEWHLETGDILIAGDGDNSFQRLDAAATHLTEIVEPGGFVNIADIAYVPGDGLYAVDIGLTAIVRIDPDTGRRTIAAQGGLMNTPLMLVAEPGGLFVTDNLDAQLIRIDLATGQQTVVSQAGSILTSFGAARGTDGLVYLADQGTDRVIRVDVADPMAGSGNQTVASNLAAYGVLSAEGLGVDLAGDLLLADPSTQQVYRLDLPFGLPESVVPQQVTTGPGLPSIQDVEQEADGDLVIAAGGALYRVPAGDTVPVLHWADSVLRRIDIVREACRNGFDDDGDGLVDLSDGGCTDASDDSERIDGAVCDNGLDDDGDGLADYPDDPDCFFPGDLSELPACSDGLDNDSDGFADFPLDPECGNALGRSESPECSNGVDDDGDGLVDFPADPGCSDAQDVDENDPLAACDDGLDNDADGAADFPSDAGCTSPTDASEYEIGAVDAQVKLSNTSGDLSGPGNPGGLLIGDEFGSSAVGIGDLDGDGVGDAVVGAHLTNGSGFNNDTGAVYVLFMRADGRVRDRVRIADGEGGLPASTLLASTEFGAAGLASLGDVDGDGVVDIAVGAERDDDGSQDAGAVYILFLQTDGTVKQFQKISATSGGLVSALSAFDRFGHALAAVGDLDHDGIPELAVGADGDDTGGTSRGAVYILHLHSDGTVAAEQKIADATGGLTTPLENTDFFGSSVTSLGDLDGDGVPELVVGARRDDDGTFDAGAVYVLFLNADGTVKAEQKISATSGGLTATLDPEDYFGSGLGRLGDLDGDGVPDLAVGAANDDDGGLNRGAVHVLLLNPDGSVKAERKISELLELVGAPLDDNDQFGSRVRGLGDLGGDGSLELLVTAPSDDDGTSSAGAAYVLSIDGSVGTCGDGILDPVEGCDDGNTADGDYCPASCRYVPEPGVALGLVMGAVWLAALRRRRTR